MKSISSHVLWILILTVLVFTTYAKDITKSKDIAQELSKSSAYKMQEPFSSQPLTAHTSYNRKI